MDPAAAPPSAIRHLPSALLQYCESNISPRLVEAHFTERGANGILSKLPGEPDEERPCAPSHPDLFINAWSGWYCLVRNVKFTGAAPIIIASSWSMPDTQRLQCIIPFSLQQAHPTPAIFGGVQPQLFFSALLGCSINGRPRNRMREAVCRRGSPLAANSVLPLKDCNRFPITSCLAVKQLRLTIQGCWQQDVAGVLCRWLYFVAVSGAIPPRQPFDAPLLNYAPRTKQSLPPPPLPSSVQLPAPRNGQSA